MKPLSTKRRPRHAPLALAVLLATLPAAHAQLSTFNGNAPVYLGSWFNGSFTEVVEFQFALDWAGWCNARAGANCQAIRYWNVGGNWSPTGIPGAAFDTVITPGQTVRVGAFNSVYRGGINGLAVAGSLDAALARVEVSGQLRVGSSAIGDYFAFTGGVLETSGLSQIEQLSSNEATFAGIAGTTRLTQWIGSPELLVRDRHRLQLIGAGIANIPRIRLEPGAVLENLGSLTLANAQLMLQGTAGPLTLPRFDNLGSLTGNGSFGALRFNNAGSVSVTAGQALDIGLLGSHSGSFQLGTGSTLSLGGFAGPGMVFEASSRVNGAGTVQVIRGDHLVQGDWQSQAVDLFGGAQIRFERAPTIGRLLLRGDTLTGATFAAASGTASVGEAVVEGGGVLTFERGLVDLGALRLVRGAVAVDTAQSVAGAFEWSDGVLRGAGGLELAGGGRLLAGSRVLNTTVTQRGNLLWEGGNFSQWNGAWSVRGGRFDIAGDFGAASAAGGGRLNLEGATLVKSAGSGRSELAMRVDTTGSALIDAREGVLALRGGLLAGGPLQLQAAPGARIELGGSTSLGAGLVQQGEIDIVGGTLTLRSGLAFASSSATSRFAPDSLVVQTGASLTRAGALTLPGSFFSTGSVTLGGNFSVFGNADNFGALSVGGNIDVRGNFAQLGTLLRPATGQIVVQGTFESHDTLRVENTQLQVGTLRLLAPLTLQGSASGFASEIDNRSTLTFANAAGNTFAVWGDVLNTGTLRVDGALQGLQHGGVLRNQGQIVNEGSWSSGGMLLASGSSFQNLGPLSQYGEAILQAGSAITGSGRFEQFGPLMRIDAGAQLQTTDLYRQWTGLTRVNGRLEAAGGILIDDGELRGTGTLVGNVSLGPTAVWLPGNSIGTQTVLGNADWSGLLEIEVASATQHDRLVISGALAAGNGATLRLQLASGSAFDDGDEIRWLQAGSAGLGAATVTLQGPQAASWLTSFDPNTGRLSLFDAAAVPIDALSGQVPLGQVAFNDRDQANPLVLTQLAVAGQFNNRPGAEATFGNADVAVGGGVLQRGRLFGYGTLTQRGLWRGTAGSGTSLNAVVNEGRFEDAGTLDIGTLDNRPGAVMIVRGQLGQGSVVPNDWRNDGLLRIEGRADHTPGLSVATVRNTGILEVASGGTLNVQRFEQFYNNDVVLRVDGRMTVAEALRIGGAVQGRGVLTANVDAATAFIAPGRAAAPPAASGTPGAETIGTLTIEGNLASGGGALIDLEIAGDGTHDRLVVTGSVDWNNLSVRLQFLDPLPPATGSLLSLVSAGSSIGSLCAGCWSIDTLQPDGSWISWGQVSPWSELTVSFADGNLSIAAVPEPKAWALMFGGLFAVAFVARRRSGRR